MLSDNITPISDLNVIENIEQHLNVKAKIQSIDSKISVQQQEMNKTLAMIEQFKNCYKDQSEALKKFEADKAKVLEEYNFLVEVNKKFEKMPQIDNNQKMNTNVSGPSIGNNNRITIEILSQQNEQNSIKVQVAKNLARKLKRKNTPPNLSKPLLSKKKRSSKKSVTPEPMQCKSSDKPDSIISVLLKVDTWPLEKLTVVKDDYIIQHINCQNNEEIFMSGSNGLLISCQKEMVNYYTGHYRKHVKNLYICNNEKLLSIGSDYILINKLNDFSKSRNISILPSEITCTCIYKNKVYGTLRNGSIFFVETKSEKVQVFPNVLKECVISIIIVKLDHIKLLITANTKNEIASYSLDETNWLNLLKVKKLNDTVKGLINYSSNIICYTTHFIYILDKPLGKIVVLREITNEIMFLDSGMNTIIVLDNFNILHKYLIKKGKVKTGSTVENLPLDGTATAMSFNYQKKMIYFASHNILFSQKF